MVIAKCKIKFENNKIAENMKDTISTFFRLGECGNMGLNIQCKDNEYSVSGEPIVDKTGRSDMFMGSHAMLLAMYLIRKDSQPAFYIELEETVKNQTANSFVHFMDGSLAAQIEEFNFEDMTKEKYYLIDTIDNIMNKDSDPILYTDINDFIFDYYLAYRDMDLKFFEDDNFTKSLPSVSREGLEEQYKEFDELFL